jgi:hypothetical protein
MRNLFIVDACELSFTSTGVQCVGLNATLGTTLICRMRALSHSSERNSEAEEVKVPGRLAWCLSVMETSGAFQLQNMLPFSYFRAFLRFLLYCGQVDAGPLL